jgi:hypothetical protein
MDFKLPNLGYKGDLRNHQAIIQPRLSDCLMVSQVTLSPEPHGFDSCRGHSCGKCCVGRWHKSSAVANT